MSLSQLWGVVEPDWRWEDKKAGGIKKNARLLRATDGVVTLCRDGPGRSARGCDWTGPDGLEPYCELPYRAEQVRAEDIELAQSHGQAVTIKVVCRSPSGLSTSDTALVGGHAYELTRADTEGRDVHLYLTELESAGEVWLVSYEGTVDGLGQAHTEELPRQRAVCRSLTVGSKEGAPVLVAEMRSCDYAGELELACGGYLYSVRKAASAGQWTTAECERLGKDVRDG